MEWKKDGTKESILKSAGKASGLARLEGDAVCPCALADSFVGAGGASPRGM